jgi:CcmD family protein
MEHFGYLFAAYSIIFAAIVCYVMFIWRRQAALEVELRALEARLRALTENSARSDSSAEGDAPQI